MGHAASPVQALLVLLLSSGWRGGNGQACAQTAVTPVPGIRVEGLVATPRVVTAADLAALPHLEHLWRDKTGKKHVSCGVALFDVLQLAGIPGYRSFEFETLLLDKALLVTSANGSQVVFALPEIDVAFAGQTILLSDECDGQPLRALDWPYQLIVPLEKYKRARWVGQIVSLRVVKVQ